MSGPDPEFEEFLARRRPLFRRDVDDGLEPPAELDRIILRQAREAIEGDRPMRVFRAPRWIAPVSIAATLVLGLAIVFKAGVPAVDKVPEVTIENVAQRVEYPAATAESRTAPGPASVPAPVSEPAGQGRVVVDLASPPRVAQDTRGPVSREKAARESAPSPEAAVLARSEGDRSARSSAPMETAAVPNAAAAPSGDDAPAWRRDSKTWQAEIERLRASGDHARANAELAEFNRQHRAYAVAPDR
jgi:hypothetical protein